MKQIAAWLMVASALWSAPYQVGESLPSMALNDQFGKTHTLKTMPQTVVMAFEKGTAAMADEVLGKEAPGYLTAHHAAYIADISPMPGFIAEAFALPKMRKYPYTVLLIRDEETGLKFPAEEEKVTILRMEGNVIRAVEYVGNAAELKAALEK